MSARYRYQLRRGTSDSWASANPVLLAGEPGVDTTTDVLKIGDGVTAWAGLADALSRPVIETAWVVKVFDTGGGLPVAEMFPGADVAAWEASGGPAVWNIPTTEGLVRVMYADLIDPTRMGVYDYTPGVSFVRSPDADTTAKLHGSLISSRLFRDHLSNALVIDPPFYLTNLVHLHAVDPSQSMGTASWEFVLYTDLYTTQQYFEFVVGITGLGWTAEPTVWVGAVPANLGDAVNRIAAQLGPIA